jgi:ABC-type Fe3+ transport system, permease component
MIIVLAYFIRKTPFSVKTTSALLHQIEVSVEEASISLGVPPFATFLKVVVPSMVKEDGKYFAFLKGIAASSQ